MRALPGCTASRISKRIRITFKSYTPRATEPPTPQEWRQLHGDQASQLRPAAGRTEWRKWKTAKTETVKRTRIETRRAQGATGSRRRDWNPFGRAPGG